MCICFLKKFVPFFSSRQIRAAVMIENIKSDYIAITFQCQPNDPHILTEENEWQELYFRLSCTRQWSIKHMLHIDRDNSGV